MPSKNCPFDAYQSFAHNLSIAQEVCFRFAAALLSRTAMYPLTEQRLHIILGQRLEETGLIGDDAFHQGTLLFLQLQNLLLPLCHTQ